MSSATTSSIPIVVRRADPNAPIPSDYGVTPHGTIYATTPGGTRIIYDRKQLLSLRNSPYAQSPPASMQFIPGVTRASVGGVTSPLHQQVFSANMTEDKAEDGMDDVEEEEEAFGEELREQDFEASRTEEHAVEKKEGVKHHDVFEMDM